MLGVAFLHRKVIANSPDILHRRDDTMNAQSESMRYRSNSFGHVRRAQCPWCQGTVERIHRRFIDRLMSPILPRYRYRCLSLGCDWEGNLPVRGTRYGE